MLDIAVKLVFCVALVFEISRESRIKRCELYFVSRRYQESLMIERILYGVYSPL
jgi:hypothetical protein